MNHVLICGLGSIGQRHATILRKLGINRIDVFRSGHGTLALDSSIEPNHVYNDYSVALSESPSMVLVTNPTALHEDTAIYAIESGAHVFVEKPIGVSVKKCMELNTLARGKKCVLAVGYNMRFHPLLQKTKAIINSGELGDPIHATATFRAWLPGWHPWEDYRHSYAARSDLGGGATLTHIHEINYLHWFFGATKNVHSAKSSGNFLESDVDEFSTAVLEHEQGVISTVTLDLFYRKVSRSLLISFTQGHLFIDLISGQMVIYSELTTTVQAPKHVIDKTYEDQMIAFVDVCRGKKPFDQLCGARDAIVDLEVANRIISGENGELRSNF